MVVNDVSNSTSVQLFSCVAYGGIRLHLFVVGNYQSPLGLHAIATWEGSWHRSSSTSWHKGFWKFDWMLVFSDREGANFNFGDDSGITALMRRMSRSPSWKWSWRVHWDERSSNCFVALQRRRSFVSLLEEFIESNMKEQKMALLKGCKEGQS